MFATTFVAINSILLEHSKKAALSEELAKVSELLKFIGNLDQKIQQDCAIITFYLFLLYLNSEFSEELKTYVLAKGYLRLS
ncbi:MAG: hypothetical protein WC748_01385 [Legionellales bacterium]|jgi:hypothetical protein